MLKQVFVIAKQEFKSLLKNWITIIATIAFIIAPIYVYSPIKSKEMWTNLFAAYQCNNGLVALAIVVIPIITLSIYYKDEITEMPVLIFSQSIVGKTYALGKFLGAYMYCLFFCIIENIIWIFMPLYFKQVPYSPIPFLKYFIIYSAISFLAMVALSYFLEVVFRIKPVTIFISMFIFIGLTGENIPQFTLIISSLYMDNLYTGKALAPDIINQIMINRIFIMTLATILIVISLFKFSTEKLIDRR